jgi:hypothetical protein
MVGVAYIKGDDGHIKHIAAMPEKNINDLRLYQI